jgi:hypothetical protein
MGYTLEKYRACGSRSDFYTLKDSAYGFKTFRNKKDADYARDTQIMLAELNLAPRVYSEVGKIRIGKSKKRQRLSNWGYITEIAEIVGCGEPGCSCDICYEVEEDLCGEIAELQMTIDSDTGYSFGDAHIGNVGYVNRNGMDILVCIDTGEESVSNYSECDCTACQVINRKKNV